jgi:hypothetical protein
MLRQGLAITGALLLLVCQGNGESRIVEGLRDLAQNRGDK